ALPSVVGVVSALGVLALGVGVATWPIAGRTAEEWAPAALRHLASTSALGGRRHGSRRGVRIGAGAGTQRAVRSAVHSGPDPLVGGALMGVEAEGRRGRLGVVCDSRRRTFTAVLEAAAPGFVLLGENDKARRVDAWAGVLASLARTGSPIHRLQWVERF